MRLYVDITEFVKSRITTGIQRVIREFLKSALNDDINLYVIYYESKQNTYYRIDNFEVLKFLDAIKTYQFITKETIDFFDHIEEEEIFFDLDSVWNADQKREYLYKRLKQKNIKIYNFIYDVIPLKFPELIKSDTRSNFASYIDAVNKNSDGVFFDSYSAMTDFNMLNIQKGVTNTAIKKVVYPGSDFNVEAHNDHNQYKHLLSTKYILFVGTIEPRKQQTLVVDAFESLHVKYPDLHLILIGKIGWQVEDFMNYLKSHPLKDKKIFHLDNIDDNVLHLFYRNAFIVTYLSRYEGYGLPVAESLQNGNITIAFNNSSIFEVGGDFADYIAENSIEELVKTISSYLDDKVSYDEKKSYIKTSYRSPSWDDFYNELIANINFFR